MRVTWNALATLVKHGGVSKISDVQRRITMLWDSRGANQVRASIGQMQQGMQGYRTEVQKVTNEQGRLDKQMRAFGTTMRYALAGGVLFGTVNAIRSVGEFQAKLGQLSAIGSSPGIPLVGKQLDDLGNSLLKISTETVTPVSELQEALINLYSTIEGLTPDQATQTLEIIAKTAKVSQADIVDTTQAIAGMVAAFDKGMKDVSSIGNEFFVVTKYASGGLDFARTYAQQLGKLSRDARLGGFTMPEMSAIAIAGSKFGGSPASNLRAQEQLLRTVKHPSNVKSEAFYERAGVGKSVRTEMGGFEVLMKLLTFANTLPKGARAEFISGAFTRAESRGQASLLADIIDRKRFAKDYKGLTLQEYLTHTQIKQANIEGAGTFEKFQDRAALSQAGIAMQNFSLAYAQAFLPVLNPGAKLIKKGSQAFQGVAQDHPYGVMGATFGALLGGYALKKGKIPFLAGRFGLPGLSKAGMLAAAGSDILQGGRVRGDSPLNPLYVVMVSELLGSGKGVNRRGMWGAYPSPIGPTLPGGEFYTRDVGRKVPPILATTGRGGNLLRTLLPGALGFARYAKIAAGGAGGAMMVPLLFDEITSAFGMDMSGMSERDKKLAAFPRMNRLLHRDLKKRPWDSLSPVERQALKYTRDYGGWGPFGKKEGETKPRLKAAEAMLDNAMGLGTVKVRGEATVTVNIDQTDNKGNIIRKSTRVPMGLYSDFNPAPTTAGKHKTTRGK